jgi:hypothetical protein
MQSSKGGHEQRTFTSDIRRCAALVLRPGHVALRGWRSLQCAALGRGGGECGVGGTPDNATWATTLV